MIVVDDNIEYLMSEICSSVCFLSETAGEGVPANDDEAEEGDVADGDEN